MMWLPLKHPGAKQRFLLVYASIVVVAAAGMSWLYPHFCWPIVGMALVGLAAAWLVAWWSARSLRRQLHSLRKITEAITRGDLNGSWDASPYNDFEKLAETLDQVAQQLRDTYQERERLRKQLSRSERLAVIGELAATVAHEVNNPLDGLRNSTRLLRKKGDGQPQSEQLLTMMEAGLNRIERLVQHLLDMARDEPLQAVPVCIEDVADDAELFVRPRLNRSNIRLIRDFPETPIPVLADRVQLSQVFINLMINGVDAMTDGGEMTLRYRLDDGQGNMVIEVRDTGAGIANDELADIFEPFYTTKKRGLGTGLGLSIAHRIIEAHHGRITVQSTPGRGTCFRIELPALTNGLSAEAIAPLQTTWSPSKQVDNSLKF